MKFVKSLGVSFATMALAFGNNAVYAQQSAKPATITVDAAKSLGPVNPLVFGDNIEAADSKHIYGDTTNPFPIETGTGFWDDVAKKPNPSVVTAMRQLRLSALRYPGGTLANLFDWKKAVGPLSTRGDWHFGIDEYIATCRAIGCEPQFIVADYTGTPKDAAEMIEYLNSPATPRHPWAMRRAQWGHVQPYHVRYFELGNETDAGGGYPRRTMTSNEYCVYANATIKAMKAVDSGIKCGIISGTGKAVDDPWNYVVVKGAGSSADFLVVHLYLAAWDPNLPYDVSMRACMATPDQLQGRLNETHDLIRHTLGHDLPIGLTEYNGGFGTPDPPLRFSYGAALMCSDILRVLLRPANHILMANYWQAVDGYWGFFYNNNSGDNWSFKPAYYTRLLWGEHSGKTLIASVVNGPKTDFEGNGPTDAAHGTVQQVSHVVVSNLLSPQIFRQQSLGQGWSVESSGLLSYHIKNATTDQYPVFATVASPTAGQHAGSLYKVSADVRAVPDAGSRDAHVSLGLSDSRGWEATHSAIMTNGGHADGQWRHVSGVYAGLFDGKTVDALARLENVAGTFSGTVQVKNLTLQASTRSIFPAYDLITAQSTLSADGKTLYMIVFNKSTTQDIPGTINIRGTAASSAHAWTVSGPDLAGTTTGPGGVRMTISNISVPLTSARSVSYVFPARSMTAFNFSLKDR